MTDLTTLSLKRLGELQEQARYVRASVNGEIIRAGFGAMPIAQIRAQPATDLIVRFRAAHDAFDAFDVEFARRKAVKAAKKMQA